MSAETNALQQLEASLDYRDRHEAMTGVSLYQCPKCHSGRMLTVEEIEPRATSPPFPEAA